MTAKTKSSAAEVIKVGGTSLVVIMSGIIISMIGYWGNKINATMDRHSAQIDTLNSKVAVNTEKINGNTTNIVQLTIDDINAKTDISILKTTSPYFKNNH